MPEAVVRGGQKGCAGTTVRQALDSAAEGFAGGLNSAAEGFAGASVRQALARATAQLDAAGCDTPRLDAELLLGETLGVERARLVMDAKLVLDGGAAARFAELLERRRAREPVAYILGRRDFRYLSLAVDRRVLIPRPETELLVEAALDLRAGARVIDVGTGSGAVALALKQERPDLDVWGSDVSLDALQVARANATALGLSVQFVAADLLAGAACGRFDAVLANLPYVAVDESLPPEVAWFEPAEALYAGADGLAAVRSLVASLGETPLVALEIGAGQADAVSELLTAAGYGSVQRRRDLAGVERMIVAFRDQPPSSALASSSSAPASSSSAPASSSSAPASSSSAPASSSSAPA